MTEPFVTCEGLVRIHKVADLEVVALKGLDLSVAKGELVGIVGPSGSGKTTLLNILGGLDRPSAGKAVVAGQNLLELTTDELTRYRRTTVGFVWQQSSRNLIPYLSAAENVGLPMALTNVGARIRRRRVGELLDAVELPHRSGHRLGELSGGEQKRVAIAVALANDPQLVLADEPTGEVDDETSHAIYRQFRTLAAKLDVTTLIVSHDPDLVHHVDRSFRIEDGRLASESFQTAAVSPPADTEQDRGPAASPQPIHERVVVDATGRLQVPEDLRQRFGIGDRAVLEASDEGVLIKPAPDDGADQRGSVPRPSGQSRWRRQRLRGDRDSD